MGFGVRAAGGKGDELGVEPLHRSSSPPTSRQGLSQLRRTRARWEAQTELGAGVAVEETQIQPAKGQGKFRGQSSEVRGQPVA